MSPRDEGGTRIGDPSNHLRTVETVELPSSTENISRRQQHTAGSASRSRDGPSSRSDDDDPEYDRRARTSPVDRHLRSPDWAYRNMATTRTYLHLAGVVFRDEAERLERRLSR